MPEQTDSNLEIQRILLDIFSTSTHLPIGLFDVEQRRAVFSAQSLRCFEPYCRRVHQLPGEAAECARDQWKRARETKTEGLTLCHAGLYDYALPIFVDGQLAATLLYGEMQLEDRDLQQRATLRHEQFMHSRRLPQEVESQLRETYARAKRLRLDQFGPQMLANLHRIEKWYYRLTSSQKALTRQTEDLTHELQIWLQGVMAKTENLCLDLERDRDVRREYKETARDVLSAAVALDVIVQRLGNFMTSYRSIPVRLATIVHESRKVYEEEARQRGISVKIDLEPVDGRPAMVEASVVHLQHAVHNRSGH